MEGRRVNDYWCMGVVSYGYLGLGGGVDGMHVVQSQDGFVTYREMPEHFPNARCGHR